MHSGFVIYSYFKDSVFTACFKRDAKFQIRYVKGVPSANRRYTEGVFLPSKMVYNVKG